MSTEPLPIYVLGAVDWLTSQALYHGLAGAGEEGVVLCRPSEAYVSLGCHEPYDDWNEAMAVPVVRRRVGGTLVYLDEHQVFYQVILSPDRLRGHGRPQDWYRLALTPVVTYLESLGYRAELRLPADILADGKKISGNAGGQIGDQMVVVGNLLVKFDVDRMAAARAVPHPEMRAVFAQSMRRHLTTLSERYPELSPERVMTRLGEVFKEAWGGVYAAPRWDKWAPALDRARVKLTSPDWLRSMRAPASPHRVKVREGVYLRLMQERDHDFYILEQDDSGAVLRRWPVAPLDAARVARIESLPVSGLLHNGKEQ